MGALSSRAIAQNACSRRTAPFSGCGEHVPFFAPPVDEKVARGGLDFAWEPIVVDPRSELGRIGDCVVKKIQEYLEHASECRTLARTVPPAHREQLEEMALTWEQLAEARRGKIKKQLKMKSARHPSAI
jgi:hypothetical protein